MRVLLLLVLLLLLLVLLLMLLLVVLLLLLVVLLLVLVAVVVLPLMVVVLLLLTLLSWGPLGVLLGLSRCPLGALLNGFGVLLGALGAVLGASWAPLGALLGHLGAILRPQERIGSEEAGRPKSLIFLRFWKDFGFLGGSRGGSESTWGRLVALLEPLEGMSEAILHHLRLSWPILEAILEHLRPSWGHLVPKRAV